MYFLSALSIVCGYMLHVSMSTSNTHYCIPRNTVPYNNELRSFKEDGIFNYSTMLIQEEVGVLLLGAREAVYALDIDNISNRTAAVYWRVPDEKRRECTYKGKQAEVECRNYIRTLHRINDTTMYVCGTNAFSPICGYMTLENGLLRLEHRPEEGKGKCPFDPFQRYSSLMVGSDLFSATSINFLGSEPVVLRSSSLTLRTEFKNSWLNEPNFVYMDIVEESVNSPDGDDDKIYMFFSENAMEYDFYSKVAVSRVARVCKGDMGGKRTLQRKWTSFLKARLDCSLPEPSLPPVVQDVFLLKHKDWRESIFYVVFTPQSSLSQVSAVCAYKVSDIRNIFTEGKFMTPVAVETSYVKWVTFTGDVPVPRPGACINNLAREMGFNRSLDLPDKTLQFIRDRPLMDEAVLPVGGEPLVVKTGALFSHIVVDRVRALNGQTHDVMFIGTENGFIQKAVNYGGEKLIIEEVQVFENQDPISILRLSSSKGQLFAGSDLGVVQMPVSNCSRYESCVDCVLARDPYCAWDSSSQRCSSISTWSSPKFLLQSLKDGNVSQCPPPDPVARVDIALTPGNSLQLPCELHSNLAQVHWSFNDQALHPNHKYYFYSGGLLLLATADSDYGLYVCDSVEQINGRTYVRTMAVYHLHPGRDSGDPTTPAPEATSSSKSPTTAAPEKGVVEPLTPGNQKEKGQVSRLEVAVGLLSLLCLSLLAVILWMYVRGRLECLKMAKASNQIEAKRREKGVEYAHIQTSEIKLLGPDNNNHCTVNFKENGVHRITSIANISSLNGLGYINDESEI